MDGIFINEELNFPNFRLDLDQQLDFNLDYKSDMSPGPLPKRPRMDYSENLYTDSKQYNVSDDNHLYKDHNLLDYKQKNFNQNYEPQQFDPRMTNQQIYNHHISNHPMMHLINVQPQIMSYYSIGHQLNPKINLAYYQQQSISPQNASTYQPEIHQSINLLQNQHFFNERSDCNQFNQFHSQNLLKNDQSITYCNQVSKPFTDYANSLITDFITDTANNSLTNLPKQTEIVSTQNLSRNTLICSDVRKNMTTKNFSKFLTPWLDQSDNYPVHQTNENVTNLNPEEVYSKNMQLSTLFDENQANFQDDHQNHFFADLNNNLCPLNTNLDKYLLNKSSNAKMVKQVNFSQKSVASKRKSRILPIRTPEIDGKLNNNLQSIESSALQIDLSDVEVADEDLKYSKKKIAIPIYKFKFSIDVNEKPNQKMKQKLANEIVDFVVKFIPIYRKTTKNVDDLLGFVIGRYVNMVEKNKTGYDSLKQMVNSELKFRLERRKELISDIQDAQQTISSFSNEMYKDDSIKSEKMMELIAVNSIEATAMERANGFSSSIDYKNPNTYSPNCLQSSFIDSFITNSMDLQKTELI